MKKATITTVLQGCKGPQGRTRLAVLIGGVAMLLLLLSELMPTGTKSAAASTAPQEIAAYQTQLENRLETLIAQMDGAGKTTVMLTLETGEETIYALDTQSGQMQERRTSATRRDRLPLQWDPGCAVRATNGIRVRGPACKRRPRFPHPAKDHAP